jgi:hypothetical protein
MSGAGCLTYGYEYPDCIFNIAPISTPELDLQALLAMLVRHGAPDIWVLSPENPDFSF